MSKNVINLETIHPTWRFSKLPRNSIPHRRANCLNYAASHKLYGTEAQIENQRKTYLVNSRQEAKQFLRKHSYVPVEENAQNLHYQIIPQSEIGYKRNTGSFYSDTATEVSAPRSSPVSIGNDYLPDSVFAHLNARCAELDGAIRNLTKIALEHLKQDRSRVLTIGKKQILKSEINERNRNYVHRPSRQSLTKVTFDGSPGVTISLPIQRAKTLPENILKLVQSTSDVPQTRFRYQKSSSSSNLMKSRPSSYQVAYHKEKERFKDKLNGSNIDTISKTKSNIEQCRKYGDFGCSSSQGHRKLSGSSEREYQFLENIYRTTSRVRNQTTCRSSHGGLSGNKSSCGRLPQISTPMDKGRMFGPGDHTRQMYDRWSRTKSSANDHVNRPRTSSFPAIYTKSSKS